MNNLSHQANVNPTNPLLAIVELGGYPDFSRLYKRHGYQPIIVFSMRKALAALKTITPRVIVAEFNYQSDFRDRTSSLESLIAVAQQHPQIRLIVFFEKQHEHQLQQLRARYKFFATLAYPVNEAMMQQTLARLATCQNTSKPA